MKTIALIAIWATGGSAAGGATIEAPSGYTMQEPSEVAVVRPSVRAIDRKCTVALKRLRLEYRSIDGPYGGCGCIARQLESKLGAEEHQAALDTFLTAVLARKAKPEDMPQIRNRFRDIRAHYALSIERYRGVIRSTTAALKSCG